MIPAGSSKPLVLVPKNQRNNYPCTSQSPTHNLQFYCPNFILHIYFVYIIYDKFDVLKKSYNCSNETENLKHIVYFKHIFASFNFIKSVWLIYIILLSRVT